MKQHVQKILFFVISMVILFALIMLAVRLRGSDNPYVRFPNKIDTFR